MDYFAFQFHITDQCDQRCEHCYIFAEGHDKLVEMPFEKVIHVIDEAREMCRVTNTLPYFFLTGGDPILHSRFHDILEYLHSFRIPFSILGNPFHITDEACLMLKSLGCESYQLSIDGMEETHDKIRKPGSFRTTVDKIEVLRRNGIEAAIMTTISGTNKDEITDIIDTVVDKHADSFSFARYCPTSQEKSTHLSPLEYRGLLDKIWKKFAEHKDKGTAFGLKDHLWKLYLHEEGLLTLPPANEEGTIYDGCHCGRSHLTILPTGDVMACRRFRNNLGNIFRESLVDIWQGDKIEEYRDVKKFAKCKDCRLLNICRGCPAVAYGYYNDFYAPDPQCWKDLTIHE